MSRPINVSVPLEALENVRSISLCEHEEDGQLCLRYASYGRRILNYPGNPVSWLRACWYCDKHSSPDDEPTNNADHADALNRAIEWGQSMRAAEGGKP